MIIKIFYIYHKINLIFLFYKLIKKYIKKFCLIIINKYGNGNC